VGGTTSPTLRLAPPHPPLCTARSIRVQADGRVICNSTTVPFATSEEESRDPELQHAAFACDPPRGRNITVSVAAAGLKPRLEGAAVVSDPLAVPLAGEDCRAPAGCALLGPYYGKPKKASRPGSWLTSYNEQPLPWRLSPKAYTAAAKTNCTSFC
jgi:hypothetical protein